jgi:spore maturation protein CgeB
VNVITALSDCDIRIYGNEAWLALLPTSIAERVYRGVLRFRHLFEVYRNACVTLNIHSLQSYTCLNVRDFDVPAAGDFCYRTGCPVRMRFNRPGFIGDLPLNEESAQEVFFYRTIPEMKKIAEYFLRHEDHRMACIDRARKRVLAGHTYAHRAQFLHELFQKSGFPSLRLRNDRRPTV